MTVKKKTPIQKFYDVVKILGAISVIIGLVAVFMAWGENNKDVETRIFESPSQKEKTRQHIDSDYNEVKNYQLMQEQKQMKVELDTAYAFVNALFKEDRARLKMDSINSASAIKSRATRDSTNNKVVKDIQQIQREQIIQTNTNQLILQELKSLRVLIDTNH
jgi:hypothetical protein